MTECQARYGPESGAEYLTSEEAAAVLKIHPKTFVLWLEQGKVPGALKLGRNWRVTRADVLALLKPPETPTTGARN